VPCAVRICTSHTPPTDDQTVGLTFLSHKKKYNTSSKIRQTKNPPLQNQQLLAHSCVLSFNENVDNYFKWGQCFMKKFIVYLIGLFLVSCSGTPADSPTAPPSRATIIAPTTPTVVYNADVECPLFVTNALQSITANCDATQRNQICYSNSQVVIEQRPNTSPMTFSNVGDIAPLNAIQRINLLSNLNNEEWGVALLRLQTNLPNTLPGQNVTVLLFGEGEFRDGQAEGYYFTSGIGQADCKGAPTSGMLVQTPQGVASVNFRLNGADVQLGSTAFIEAQRGGDMRISLLEGQATINAVGGVQTIPTGSFSTVSLDNLGVVDEPPTPPRPYDTNTFENLPLDPLERDIEIAQPASIPARIEIVYANGEASNITATLRQNNEYVTIIYGNGEVAPGNYTLEIDTSPKTLVNLSLTAGQTQSITIPRNGLVQIQDANGNVIAVILSAFTLEGEFFAAGYNGEIALLPGNYRIEADTVPATEQEVGVESDRVSVIRATQSGTIRVLEPNGQLTERLVVLYDNEGNIVDSSFDGQFEVLPGKYDVGIDVYPELRQEVNLAGGQTIELRVPPTGFIQVVNQRGVAVELPIIASQGDQIVNSSQSGRLELLEGSYSFEVLTAPETVQTLRIVQNQTQMLTIPPSGIIQVVNENQRPIEAFISVTTPNGDFVNSSSSGSVEVLEGTYLVSISTDRLSLDNQRVSVKGNSTTTITATVPR
jgi:hypothetical protein